MLLPTLAKRSDLYIIACKKNLDEAALFLPGHAKHVLLTLLPQCQSIDEVAKLRKELQDTLVVYDKACVELVNAKKKVRVLLNPLQNTFFLCCIIATEQLVLYVLNLLHYPCYHDATDSGAFYGVFRGGKEGGARTRMGGSFEADGSR